MKRLTRKSLEYKDTWIADGSLSNIEGVVRGNAIDRLAELEDVLEKYGIESVGHLEGILTVNRTITLIDIKNKEILQLENANLKSELAELKQKAIMPKFKVGQEVWWINSFNEPRYRIESYLIDSIVITNEQFRYYGDDGLWFGDNELFATKEEAEQKLAEIKGEKNE